MEEHDNDDQLQRAMLGATPASHQPSGRGGIERDPRGSQPPQDLDVAPVRTDDELLGRPKQASALVRTIVFAMSFLFIAGILAATLYIEIEYGLDPLGVFTLVVFGLVLYGLINAVRYQGKDPMAALREIDRVREAKARGRADAKATRPGLFRRRK